MSYTNAAFFLRNTEIDSSVSMSPSPRAFPGCFLTGGSTEPGKCFALVLGLETRKSSTYRYLLSLMTWIEVALALTIYKFIR